MTLRQDGNMVTLTLTPAEVAAMFRYKSEAAMLEQYESAAHAIADQWELDGICHNCLAALPCGPAPGTWYGCGDCHGGDDPGYGREPATFVDPDSGLRLRY